MAVLKSGILSPLSGHQFSRLAFFSFPISFYVSHGHVSSHRLKSWICRFLDLLNQLIKKPISKKRVVQLSKCLEMGLKPSDILTREAFEDAITVTWRWVVQLVDCLLFHFFTTFWWGFFCHEVMGDTKVACCSNDRLWFCQMKLLLCDSAFSLLQLQLLLHQGCDRRSGVLSGGVRKSWFHQIT